MADLDDTPDGLEHAVGTLIAAVQNGEHWTAIDYDGRSRAEFLTIPDGTEYKREIISLKKSLPAYKEAIMARVSLTTQTVTHAGKTSASITFTAPTGAGAR